MGAQEAELIHPSPHALMPANKSVWRPMDALDRGREQHLAGTCYFNRWQTLFPARQIQ